MCVPPTEENAKPTHASIDLDSVVEDPVLVLLAPFRLELFLADRARLGESVSIRGSDDLALEKLCAVDLLSIGLCSRRRLGGLVQDVDVVRVDPVLEGEGLA